MKDSGVTWLGAVPEHWEIRTIKTLFREKDGRNHDGKEMLLSLTRDRGIVPHSEVSTRPVTASDLSKYKLCTPGDLVMNRMQAWSGMFAVSPYCGLVSPDYSVFAPTTESATHVRFFELLFKAPMFVDQFAKRSKGIGSGFNRLYTPDFGSVYALSPPSAEQTAIVCYLDHADRRIRRYIRSKERLIELLEEQKQAIIHQAVTGPDRCPNRPALPGLQGLRRGVAWQGAGALGCVSLRKTHWPDSWLSIQERRVYAICRGHKAASWRQRCTWRTALGQGRPMAQERCRQVCRISNGIGGHRLGHGSPKLFEVEYVSQWFLNQTYRRCSCNALPGFVLVV